MAVDAQPWHEPVSAGPLRASHRSRRRSRSKRPATSNERRERLPSTPSARPDLPDGRPTVERGIVDRRSSHRSHEPRAHRSADDRTAARLHVRRVPRGPAPRERRGCSSTTTATAERSDDLNQRRGVLPRARLRAARLRDAVRRASTTNRPTRRRHRADAWRSWTEDTSRNHDTMACLPQRLRYFLEPVAVALNHTRAASTTRHRDDRALRRRLDDGRLRRPRPARRRSYPVAGSKPYHVTRARAARTIRRSAHEMLLDFEQRDAGLLSNRELPRAVRARRARGPGRKQLTINNVYDPCCFAGTHHREWAPDVRDALRRLGAGEYAALGDTTHRDHAVSPFALRAIERDLRRALREAR